MTRFASALVLILLLAVPARADVVDAAPGGFTVKVTADVTAIPQAAYLALVIWIGSWWDSNHTWSGDATNLSIDARAGGCFCERLPGGGSVQHMTVVRLDPGKMVRMAGGLGPLQEMAVSGSMTWSFLEKPDRTTRVEMTYAVGGYTKAGLQSLASAVDAVLTAQVQRLKRYLEDRQ